MTKDFCAYEHTIYFVTRMRMSEWCAIIASPSGISVADFHEEPLEFLHSGIRDGPIHQWLKRFRANVVS